MNQCLASKIEYLGCVTGGCGDAVTDWCENGVYKAKGNDNCAPQPGWEVCDGVPLPIQCPG